MDRGCVSQDYKSHRMKKRYLEKLLRTSISELYKRLMAVLFFLMLLVMLRNGKGLLRGGWGQGYQDGRGLWGRYLILLTFIHSYSLCPGLEMPRWSFYVTDHQCDIHEDP